MSPPRTTRRGLLAALATAGLAGCSAPESSSIGARSPTADDRGTPSRGESSGDNRFSRVYREAVDEVVLVQTYTRRGAGQASGFVFDDGWIVTNHHVVAPADGVDVKFNGGEWRSATVEGADAYSDLAVLSIPDLPGYVEPLPWSTEEVFVGQEVIALGNPFGLSSSVSSGIVSGTNRALPGPNGFTIPGAIQTTAAVNPGNSGGPLLTMDGDVAGVITAAGGENIGFAISVPLLRRIIPSLVDDGEHRHPYMGVRLLEVTPLVADANDLSEATGVLVESVAPDGPADGVLRGSGSEEVRRGQRLPVGGDVIVELDGRRILSHDELSTHLALETRPGDDLDVVVLRDGEDETVELTLGTRPPP